MPQITLLENQKKAPGRVNLYLDNRFAFGLSQELALKVGLVVGKELSEKEVVDLKNQIEEDEQIAGAYHYLSYRPRSEQELNYYLEKKGVKKIVATGIISRLKKEGYLNDEKFADWWREQRNQFRPRSRFILTGELVRKGVNREVIGKVLSDFDEQALVDQLIEQKISRLKRTSGLVEKEKLIGYLKRRGFSWSAIKLGLEKQDL